MLFPLVAGFAVSASGDEAKPLTSNPQPDLSSNLDDYARWTEVDGFRGYYVCRRTAILSSKGVTGWTDQHNALVGGATFELTQTAPHFWKTKSAHVTGSLTETRSTFVTPYTEGSNHMNGSFSSGASDFSLKIDTIRGTWAFEAAGKLDRPYLVTNALRVIERTRWGKNVNLVSASPHTEYPHAGIDGQLPPKQIGPLEGVWHKTIGKITTGIDEFKASVVLAPIYKDLELVVTVKEKKGDGGEGSYEAWIPQGTWNGRAGSTLTVKARLQAVDGGEVPGTRKVKIFAFGLRDTSSEPGVGMNFPTDAAAKPNEPDLQFAQGGLTNEGGQETDIFASLAEHGHPSAEAQIECFDYGAWADLMVIAVMEDGRKITGHLAGDPAAIVITLPKRTGGSHIADAWKTKEKVDQLGDDDDNENDPVGDGFTGDGLTLYEEYRGFIGSNEALDHPEPVHFRADPLKKDLFVCNAGGLSADKTASDIRGYIDMASIQFGVATELRVHKNIVATGMVDRVVNFNHSDEVYHRCDQHAVIVEGATAQVIDVYRTEGIEFGGITETVEPQARGPFTPGTVSGIKIRTENALSDPDYMLYAIEHELGHACHMLHHGDKDIGRVYWIRGDQLPASAVGGRTAAIYEVVFTSVPSADLNQACSSQLSGTPTEISVFAEGSNVPIPYTDRRFDFPQSVYVASPGGQHSGPACIMRYYGADAYVKPETPQRRILYKDAMEPTRVFCRSRIAPPPGRYGNATNAANNLDKGCLDQLRVNDAK